jgi:hypothetical protein
MDENAALAICQFLTSDAIEPRDDETSLLKGIAIGVSKSLSKYAFSAARLKSTLAGECPLKILLSGLLRSLGNYQIEVFSADTPLLRLT